MKPFKKRVPIVYQIEAAECGAASLCMILGYYGRYIDLTQMRRDCRISRDGSRLSYLIAAAEKHGMKAVPYRCTAALAGRKFPLIAFWNYAHFLVVEGMDEKWVYMTDPAYGRRRVSREEFTKSFSGVVLELSCTDHFERCGRQFNVVAPAVSILREHRGTIIYLIILTTMINIVGLIMPSLSAMFVDYYLPFLLNADVTRYFIVFFAVLTVQAMLLLIRRYVSLKFRRIQSAEITGRVMEKLLKLPVSYFGTRSHSTISAHLNEIDGFTDFVAARLIPIQLDLFFTLLYIWLLFRYSVKIAAPTLLLILFLLAALVLLLRLGRSAAVLATSAQGRFYSSVAQNARLFETVKSVAMEDTAFAETMRDFSSWQDTVQSSRRVFAVLQAVPVAVPLLIQMFVVATGAREVIRGNLQVGDVLACQSIAMSIFAPIVQSISEFTSLQSQEVRIKALGDIIGEEPDPALVKSPQEEQPSVTGDVEMRDICFGYNTALPPVVQDISFHVPAGHSIAFVGGSGSGKSTVLKLVEGLYIPQRGELLFGGIPWIDVDRSTLADAMAVVSQTPFVFTGTVRENITLFDRGIDMREVEEAARTACVYDAIEAHPGGFNAMMSPTENGFSGGEIQRIMIARALIRRPAILILDEATSALDTVVEEEVMRNIREKHITLLVVAHRLSAIRDCDEILVLDKGRIAERGSHSELTALGGLYWKLMTSEDNDATE